VNDECLIDVAGVPSPRLCTFDHILRSAESYAEKWAYVVANPVRAGLVREGETWPWQGEIFSLRCE